VAPSSRGTTYVVARTVAGNRKNPRATVTAVKATGTGKTRDKAEASGLMKILNQFMWHP
jgi:hypothetical protein